MEDVSFGRHASDTSSSAASEVGSLTLADIRAAVADIDAIKGDDESAHGREDDLRRAFIQHVAAHGRPAELAEMAREVLRTDEMDFERWCA
jgi:hypothetical protein